MQHFTTFNELTITKCLFNFVIIFNPKPKLKQFQKNSIKRCPIGQNIFCSSFYIKREKIGRIQKWSMNFYRIRTALMYTILTFRPSSAFTESPLFIVPTFHESSTTCTLSEWNRHINKTVKCKYWKEALCVRLKLLQRKKIVRHRTEISIKFREKKGKKR